MATRIKFKNAGRWMRENPGLALSGASVAIGGTNLATNTLRRSESKDYQKKQLQAMNRLTNAIKGLDDKIEYEAPEKKINMINFKLKK